MIISMVVAASENWAIGKDNRLLWHLPDDLKHFKDITSGGTMIMGRRTFESIGKTLPGRVTIVVTSNKNYDARGAVVVASPEEALEKCKSEKEVNIVGGGEIFKKMLPQTDTIYLTRVHAILEGDTFFPALNMDEWIVAEEELHPADEKHKYDFTFLKLVRKTSP